MRKFFLIPGLLIVSCSLAPKYTKPEMNVQQQFKEAGNWKIAEPAENKDRGAWWKIFNDTQLDSLETEAVKANQSLKAAAARVQQARAAARAARASFFPEIDLGGNAVRSKTASAEIASYGLPAEQLKPYTLYSAGGSVSYEADLFGEVQDTYKAAKFGAKSEAATYRSVLLALQADVAQNYFMLRSLDAERALLRDTVKIRTEANRIMQDEFKVGETGEQDAVRTETELASAKADLAALDKNRAEAEHALAVLLGKTPAEFTFAEVPLSGEPPAIPAGLPSALLERRPDISAAQYQMKAANSRIGVARSAFFPSLLLTGSGGFESTALHNLFDWSNRTWALGPLVGSALTMPLFDGGKNFADLDLAKSGYDESVANYRQQVLVAFREVEDNLSDQRLLADQLREQETAANSAKRSAELSRKRYQEGETDYFEVVDEDRTSLAQQRALVEVRGARFATTVTLIRALGGGWN